MAWINVWSVLISIGLLLVPLTHAHGAPSAACVQEITGHINPGEREIYRLANLRRGDTLYIYMQRLSGSLDPLFAIADGQFTMKLFDDQLQAKLKKTPHSPFNVFRDLLDTFYLAWDDDSGKGTDAALSFRYLPTAPTKWLWPALASLRAARLWA